MNNPIEPNHYKQIQYCECINITERLPFCLGNVVKYIWRAGDKDDISQDFQKAIWYLERAMLNSDQLNGVEYDLCKVALELRDKDNMKSKLFELIADYKWLGAIKLIKQHHS